MTQDLTVPELFHLIPDEDRERHRAVFVLIAEAVEQMRNVPISPFFMLQAMGRANSALSTAVNRGLCGAVDYVILARGWTLVARCHADSLEFSFTFGEIKKAPPVGRGLFLNGRG